MLGWFQALMPKEMRFFALFVQHATIVVAGAQALRGLLQGAKGSSTTAGRSSNARLRLTKSLARS
jgi:hypothetical protein